MSPGRRVLLATLAVVSTAAPAHAASKVVAVGGQPGSARVCGSATGVRDVALGKPLSYAVAPARTRKARKLRVGATLVLDRCDGGSWTTLHTYRLGKRHHALVVQPSTAASADYRVRTRARGGKYGPAQVARVGVGEIVDVPVAFAVVNQNRTNAPCMNAPDGKAYTIHGSLVAPRTLLEQGAPAVTLYLHGLGYSSFFFRFQDVPGYDYGMQQAEAGHASVVIDRLGNPAHDDLKDGNATCVPAQADMADQMITELRQGHFAAGADAQRAFGKVVLAGHSLGGMVAELAQLSFHSADALALIAYNDTPSTLAFSQFGAANADCATAPDSARADGGAPNYAPFGETDADFAQAHFYDIDPVVEKDVLARHNRDPCGDLMSATQALATNKAGSGTITSPVLVISGSQDALFSPPTNQFQAGTAYPSSTDVSLVELPGTGHAVTLGRSHGLFQAAMDTWLTKHGA